MLVYFFLLIQILFINAQTTIDPKKRVDCYPSFDKKYVTQVICEARGCIWDPVQVRKTFTYVFTKIKVK